jgi:hypothetical protein
MKSTENNANGQQELEKRRGKSRRSMNHASRCTLSLSLEFANAANKRNRLAAFIKNIQTVTVIGYMTGSAKSAKERRTGRNTEATNGVIRVSDQKKPNVWDLTCMPRVLSVEETVNLSNEAFPLLDNQYWKAGEAQKIYKQFGMEWSYL